MSVDEPVYPSRVRSEVSSVLRRQGSRVLFGQSPDAELARFAIHLERGSTDYLGQLSCCCAAHDVHLPQPVLRGDVTLHEKRVFY